MLTSKQRAYLRGLAAPMETTFHVGKGGVGDETVKQLHLLLEARELIKLRVLETSPRPARETADVLAAQLSAEAVQVMGRCVTLYRPASQPEKRKIALSRER